MTNDKNEKYILIMVNHGGGLKQVVSGRTYEIGTIIPSKASKMDRGRNYFVLDCVINPEYIEASTAEINDQLSRVAVLNTMDYDSNPDKYNKLLDECTIFENKYC
jgi:hypothetical protein